MSEEKIMLGNETIARGAYEAGVKVSAAYSGTPSAEIRVLYRCKRRLGFGSCR